MGRLKAVARNEFETFTSKGHPDYAHTCPQCSLGHLQREQLSRSDCAGRSVAAYARRTAADTTWRTAADVAKRVIAQSARTKRAARFDHTACIDQQPWPHTLEG